MPANTTEPYKSLHARDLDGNMVAGGQYQSIRDLMELSETFDENLEGLSLGWVLTSIGVATATEQKPTIFTILNTECAKVGSDLAAVGILTSVPTAMQP